MLCSFWGGGIFFRIIANFLLFLDKSQKSIYLSKVEHKVLVFDKEVYASNYLKTSASYRILPLIEVIEKDLLEHKQAIEKNMMMYGNSYNKEY